MKKRNIGLCAVALFCMHNNAKAMEAFLKQDNTTVVNHAQIAAAYKTNRPAVALILKPPVWTGWILAACIRQEYNHLFF